MPPSAWLPVSALVVLSGIMAGAWHRQRRTGNAAVVDLIWSASLGVLAVVYALGSDGWLGRRVLVAALAGVWSTRLAVHLYRRVTSEAEDGRYAILREQWGTSFQRWMFWFFQAQALLAVLLSLAFLLPMQAELAGWRGWDVAAVLLWLVSLGGESLADAQLAAWRRDPANKGKTCRRGLWAWSRHPNYFFEWLHWLVYPLVCVGLPYGWLAWLAPGLMLYLVHEVTGIPPTEEQSLRSRGDDYRAYQRTTNAFFPGPPKSDPQRRLETS